MSNPDLDGMDVSMGEILRRASVERVPLQERLDNLRAGKKTDREASPLPLAYPRIKTTTEEDVVGQEVATMVDRAAASACNKIASLQKELNSMQQAIIFNADKAKAVLQEHIELGKGIYQLAERVEDSMRELSEQFNLGLDESKA